MTRRLATFGAGSAVAVAATVAFVGGCTLDLAGAAAGTGAKKPGVSGPSTSGSGSQAANGTGSHTSSGASGGQTGSGSQTTGGSGVVDASLGNWSPATPTVEVVR